MQIGDKAPDFELMDQDGQPVRLYEAAGRITVIFFYPRDGTPLCTREAKAFRDSYPEFQLLGARVLGVSSDPVASHKRFAGKNALPFPLLADTGGKVRQTWRVPTTLGIIPGRTTFVIDANGMAHSIFTAQLEPGKHVATALETVRRLVQSGS